MRVIFPLLVVAPFVFAVGCGVQPSPTVYVTVPVTKPAVASGKAKPTQAAKTTEPAKAVDPWEEARAYFKRVKEGEREATEAKLKMMDKGEENLTRALINLCRNKPMQLDTGDFPSTNGQRLWAMGFTEFITSCSASAIDDKRFVAAFHKLNPNPTTEEIVNGAIRYSITYFGIRGLTLKAIESGQDTRDHADTHRAATAWSGK